MINKTKYYIERTNLNDKWDKFIYSSPDSSKFLTSEYIQLLDINVHAYFCYKSKEIMGAILCIPSEDEKSIIGSNYVIYDGLVYRDLSHLNRSQQFSEKSSIQECVAEELSKLYSSIQFTLHPSVVDIRSFLWFNYDNDEKKYNSEIRYTSLLDLKEFSQNNDYNSLNAYKNASVARRQEIRYAIKKNVQFNEFKDIEKFIAFYSLTMKRQGIDPNPNDLFTMKNLLNGLLKNESIIMTQSSDCNNKIGSMAIFLIYKKIAYYLFGANDPEMRDQHTGTSVIWKSFSLLAKNNIDYLDLEGINSPKRGWFKLSFGGSVQPYYRIRL